jgi:hypothetical protein
LDIEADPAAQGLELHAFDLILASDVLHATCELRRTLGNVKKLLASEGLLVLLEGTRTPRWGILTFGLLKGWWRFVDEDLRSLGPWLSRQAWQALLTEIGFGEVACIADTGTEAKTLQAVILARGPQIQQNETTFTPENLESKTIVLDSKTSMTPDSDQAGGAENDSKKQGTWLIFADSGGVAEQLAGLLRERREIPLLILPGAAFQQLRPDRFQIRAEQPEDMRQFLEAIAVNQPPCRGIIHLWSLDAASPDEMTLSDLEAAQTLGCLSVLHLVQGLGQLDWRESPRLWLVTRNAQAVVPKQ